MSSPKTSLNKNSVHDFLNSVEDEKKREDAFRFLEFFERVSGEPAKMWGDSIVGFGSYHYVYASGREGDWMLTGFSPRKQQFSLYLMSGFKGFEDLLAKLGKHKTAKACLYVKKWEDLDHEVLEELVLKSIEHVKELYNGKN